MTDAYFRRKRQRPCVHDWGADIRDRDGDSLDYINKETRQFRYRCHSCGVVQWFDPEERANDVHMFTSPDGQYIVMPSKNHMDRRMRATPCLRQPCQSLNPGESDRAFIVPTCRDCCTAVYMAASSIASAIANDPNFVETPDLWPAAVEGADRAAQEHRNGERGTGNGERHR